MFRNKVFLKYSGWILLAAGFVTIFLAAAQQNWFVVAVSALWVISGTVHQMMKRYLERGGV